MQSVRRFVLASAQHADPVIVCAVVHEPSIVCCQYHVPAMALRCIFQICAGPIAIFDQAALRFVPIVSLDTRDARDIHRVALRAEAGNGRFCTVDV